MKIETSDFGVTTDGQKVSLYTLTNSAGNVVQLTNYGAIITKVEVPDRSGKKANVMLGFPNLAGYLERHPYFGATVGRYANRIAGGKFQIDGKTYTLVTNNGPNHLHGGTVGFDMKVWQAETKQTADALVVVFRTESADGEEGYPGRLQVMAEYTWTNANELTFAFTATTDKPTVVNLTNHGYWNLAGAGQGNVLGTQLQLFCDRYLSVDDTLIPTGQLANVEGTPLDFRQPRTIGERIEMLPQTKGYDHCLVVNGAASTLRPAAKAVEPLSGRVMEVFTTQPGMQLYTGNHLSGAASAGGFKQHEGFCLETQHFPDSPNKPEFPTSLLRPGEKYY
ncbi:MAG: galactose mutarotase [Pirellulaceae bacterium]|nr:galactose mutarotase [Pirellulaceae bacterium]